MIHYQKVFPSPKFRDIVYLFIIKLTKISNWIARIEHSVKLKIHALSSGMHNPSFTESS